MGVTEVRGRASNVGAGREKLHPTRNIEVRAERERDAEHGAGATLELVR